MLLSFGFLFGLVSKKTSKLPPTTVGLPVVGSLFQLGHMPNESLARLSKRCGPLMTMLAFFFVVFLKKPASSHQVRPLAARPAYTFDPFLTITALHPGAINRTSLLLEWAMAELLRDSDRMAGIRIVQESDIPQLLYLQALVKETLRLHPPAPLLIPHRADVTTKVGGLPSNKIPINLIRRKKLFI
ncbi:hypothetical protein EJ110_NYTH22457 [Nymphaea thermarum]|nr:hypothetical protein EJ110_NYTH22457 [Nymphaea thermarum]